VLVSKGHGPDALALEACIHSDWAYLGMIGSERKIRLLRTDFIERELATPDEFDRVVAPIGIAIGAITVEEIGVSIAAQLVAARRLDAGALDSLRIRPRHERAAPLPSS
jgi:xanthine dehydrogenase accessory factor